MQDASKSIQGGLERPPRTSKALKTPQNDLQEPPTTPFPMNKKVGWRRSIHSVNCLSTKPSLKKPQPLKRLPELLRGCQKNVRRQQKTSLRKTTIHKPRNLAKQEKFPSVDSGHLTLPKQRIPEALARLLKTSIDNSTLCYGKRQFTLLRFCRNKKLPYLYASVQKVHRLQFTVRSSHFGHSAQRK